MIISDTVIIGFAFSAGAIAFLNPCGFAMLPTYVSYFVERNSKSQGNMVASGNSSTSNFRLILVKRLTYSIFVGLLVTAGFIAIFGLVGLGISAAGTGIVKYFPWIATLSGIIIIGIGGCKIFGKTFHINIPSPRGFVYNFINNKNNDYHNRKPLGYMNFFYSESDMPLLHSVAHFQFFFLLFSRDYLQEELYKV